MVLSAGTSPNPPILGERRAGVLLHPGSLPSGSLGDDLPRWLDFIEACGFSVWQMLPLGPVGPNGSPYSSSSAFAANENFLPKAKRKARIDEYDLNNFQDREHGWLKDFALFSVIKESQGGKPWWEWPGDFRQRETWTLAAFARDHAQELHKVIESQFRFERLWQEVRTEAKSRGVLLYGDLPMFVVADSADVWAAPHLFRLNSKGQPSHVAGVPPDAFTPDGQCWDNPVFNWNEMLVEDFAWWVRRIELELRRFDLLRWDHFRGLVETWEIPVTGHHRASDGEWKEVPGRDLLDALFAALGLLPLIAENLGIITPEVERLRRSFGLPGMHVLQFAFDGNPDNPHLPGNHEEQGVAYTGTHDNDTCLGWFRSLSAPVQEQVRELLRSAGSLSAGDPGHNPGDNSERVVVDAMIRTVLDSRSRLAVIPLQDLLGLGSEARMNTPGKAKGQWSWKFSWDNLTPGLARSVRERIVQSRRI